MMESITERQFRRWWAYHLYVEPLESERMDRRFGLLACAVESMLFGEDATMQPSNFDLSWQDREQAERPDGEDWQLMKEKANLVCQMFAAHQFEE